METISRSATAYLDGWRGVAILLVLYAHFSLGAGGDLGVQLFFVLSGLLVSDLLFQRQVGIGVFCWRRATRILPTFWLYLGAMAIYAGTLQPVPYTVPLTEMLATLASLRTYLPQGQSIWSAAWPIGHLWSLNVEVHGYLLLTLIALSTRSRRVHLAGILLSGCIALVCVTIFYDARMPPPGASPWRLRSECATLGSIASAWIRFRRARTRSDLVRHGHWAIAPLTLGAGVLCFLPGAPYLAAPGLAPLLLAVSVNYLDAAPTCLLRLLSLRPLRWFGLCSFSLYIWQQPFYKALAANSLPNGAALALAVCAGAAMFYLFEDPLRRFLNRAWDARTMRLQRHGQLRRAGST